MLDTVSSCTEESDKLYETIVLEGKQEEWQSLSFLFETRI